MPTSIPVWWCYTIRSLVQQIVVEDDMHALNREIFSSHRLFFSECFVSVQDTINKERNHKRARFDSDDRLRGWKNQRKIGVDFVISLYNCSCLDPLLRSRKLVQYSILEDTHTFVELDNVQRLINESFLVEGEARINLDQDFSGNNVQNFLAKFHQ